MELRELKKRLIIQPLLQSHYLTNNCGVIKPAGSCQLTPQLYIYFHALKPAFYRSI